MQKIAILTDSSCDLDRSTIDQYGIRVLPLTVIIGNRQYQDGLTISAEEVYRRITTEQASTSVPSPQVIRDAFDNLVRAGFTHIIAIHLAGVLSGTLETVRMVSREVKGAVIEVIDSKILSLPLGLIARQAAEWVHQNRDFDDIIRGIHALVPKARGFFVVKTLEYLKRGGRIGMVSAKVGDVLDIKPVITFSDQGAIIPYAKIRGWDRSINRLHDIAREALSKGRATVAILYAGAKEEAMLLAAQIRELPNAAEVLVRPISPTLVVHAGPGLIGLGILTEDDCL